MTETSEAQFLKSRSVLHAWRRPAKCKFLLRLDSSRASNYRKIIDLRKVQGRGACRDRSEFKNRIEQPPVAKSRVRLGSTVELGRVGESKANRWCG